MGSSVNYYKEFHQPKCCCLNFLEIKKMFISSFYLKRSNFAKKIRFNDLFHVIEFLNNKNNKNTYYSLLNLFLKHLTLQKILQFKVLSRFSRIHLNAQIYNKRDSITGETIRGIRNSPSAEIPPIFHD